MRNHSVLIKVTIRRSWSGFFDKIFGGESAKLSDGPQRRNLSFFGDTRKKKFVLAFLVGNGKAFPTAATAAADFALFFGHIVWSYRGTQHKSEMVANVTLALTLYNTLLWKIQAKKFRVDFIEK